MSIKKKEIEYNFSVDGTTRRLHADANDQADSSRSPKGTSARAIRGQAILPESFLAPDVLKYLCRELDRDKVEAEFSVKVRTNVYLDFCHLTCRSDKSLLSPNFLMNAASLRRRFRGESPWKKRCA